MSESGVKVRSDVARNRRALIDAARTLFSSEPDVPMYRIAKQAGVGQATLYRHFADRSLIAAAIARDALEEVERVSADGATLEELLGTMVTSSARVPGLRRMMAEGEGRAQLLDSRERILALVAQPLAEAQAEGRVDAGVTQDDVLLLLQMLDGGLTNATDGDLEMHRRLAPRALELALSGLRSRAPTPN